LGFGGTNPVAEFKGDTLDAFLNPNRLVGGDPKRVPAFDGVAVVAALDGETLGSFINPKGLDDEDCAGTPASGALEVDPKRECELGAGVERAPSKPNGDVDSVFVLGGAALLASKPEVEED
jgi:hypothetical protein